MVLGGLLARLELLGTSWEPPEVVLVLGASWGRPASLQELWEHPGSFPWSSWGLLISFLEPPGALGSPPRESRGVVLGAHGFSLGTFPGLAGSPLSRRHRRNRSPDCVLGVSACGSLRKDICKAVKKQLKYLLKASQAIKKP